MVEAMPTGASVTSQLVSIVIVMAGRQRAVMQLASPVLPVKLSVSEPAGGRSGVARRGRVKRQNKHPNHHVVLAARTLRSTTS